MADYELQLMWHRCPGNVWCDLLELDLKDSQLDNLIGVYIIWHGGQPAEVVRVGQGVIKDRLAAHRRDPEILAYKKHGLFVNWAAASKSACDGIEAFLARKLNPLIGAAFPDRKPTPVNFPW
jgi:hypothetical protein